MVVDLQTPRPAEELTREFAIKGGLKLSLDEVIAPVRVLKDRPRKYAIGHGNIGAAVGFRTEIVIVNSFVPDPSNDGSVHLHKVWFSSNAATLFELAIPTAAVVDLVNLASERFLRTALTGSPQAVFASKNTAAASAATACFRFTTPINETKLADFDPPFIIDPVAPRAIIFRPVSDNLGMACTFLWSEPPDPV